MDKYQAYVIAAVATFLISLNGTLLWEYAFKLDFLLPNEVCAVLGVSSTVFYVYLNYLMVDEEMDEMVAGAWQWVRGCGGGSRKSERAALDESGHSTTGLIR